MAPIPRRPSGGLAESSQFLMEGRRLFFDRLGQACDAPKLRQHPGGIHHCAARPGYDRCSSKNQVGAFEVAGSGWQRWVSGLARRHGFARQSGVVHAQTVFLDDTGIGRNVVAFGENQDIARHQLTGVEMDVFSIPCHAGIRRKHLAELLYGLL